MQTIQGYRIESLRAVQGFLDDNAHRLGDVNDSGARRTLDGVLRDTLRYAVDQRGEELRALSETQRYQSLRRVLVRNHLLPLVRTAQCELADRPELEVFTMPRGNPAAMRLATEAHGFALSAVPFSAIFIAAGAKATFIADLNAATDAMMESFHARFQHRIRRYGATRGLAIKLRAGRKLVLLLGTRVRIAVEDDAELLAAWSTISRTKRIARHSSALAQIAPVSVPALAASTMRLLPSGATEADANARPTPLRILSLLARLKRLAS